MDPAPVRQAAAAEGIGTAGGGSFEVVDVIPQGIAGPSETLVRMTERHLVTIRVAGRPATYATAHEKPWKNAVRAAVAASGVQPQAGRFAVRLEFRVAAANTPNEVWDLDNLVKPTLDAMEGVFGLRPWKGHPQPADDQVDRIEATKRVPRTDEVTGATIDVWLIEPD